MNEELERKLLGKGFIERLPMSPEGRVQTEEMFKESMEAELVPYMDEEEATRKKRRGRSESRTGCVVALVFRDAPRCRELCESRQIHLSAHQRTF